MHLVRGVSKGGEQSPGGPGRGVGVGGSSTWLRHGEAHSDWKAPTRDARASTVSSSVLAAGTPPMQPHLQRRLGGAFRGEAFHEKVLISTPQIWGDMGRYGEMWGDMGRYGEIWGDIGR